MHRTHKHLRQVSLQREATVCDTVTVAIMKAHVKYKKAYMTQRKTRDSKACVMKAASEESCTSKSTKGTSQNSITGSGLKLWFRPTQ